MLLKLGKAPERYNEIKALSIQIGIDNMHPEAQKDMIA
jgi:hypothetical protein